MRYLERLIFHPRCFNSGRSFSTKKKDLKKYYEILKVNEDSDYETVHEAFLSLAKKYHPDSGNSESNIEKFREIETAFRTISKNMSEKLKENGVEDVKIYDINHTAPQHRQYLSYEGVGIGTPMQREKHWNKVKASRAAQNVMEHRLSKATAAENALMDKSKTQVAKKHDIKTKYGFDRLVEDLIQESISKGEFNNLRGSGKPLPLHQNANPYVDFVTHKLNQVLIDNGFTPEWITLQKEIRQEIEILRQSLLRERSEFGTFPLTANEEYSWSQRVEKHDALVKKINSKITHYNLVVPLLQKQMVFISLKGEAETALKTVVNYQVKNKIKTKTEEQNSPSLFDIFSSIFK